MSVNDKEAGKPSLNEQLKALYPIDDLTEKDVAKIFEISSSALVRWKQKGLITPNKELNKTYSYTLKQFHRVNQICTMQKEGVKFNDLSIDLRKPGVPKDILESSLELLTQRKAEK